MTTNIFTTTGMGRAAQLVVDEAASFAFINFKTFNDNFPSRSAPTALIQGISLDQRTNHQINLSLRQTIYLYVFGNQMGDAVITGFLFGGVCSAGLDNTSRSAALDADADGFEDILTFYSENRVSSKNEEVEIIAGKSESLKGFLTGLHIMATDINTLLTPFNMTIKVMPPK